MAKIGDWANCKREGCGSRFVLSHHLQKYCPEHRTRPTAERYRYLREKDQPILDLFCHRQGCQRKIPAAKQGDGRVKYCSQDCQLREKDRRAGERAKQKRLLEAADRVGKVESISSQRGQVYDQIDTLGYASDIVMGEVTAAHVAELLGVSPAAVSKALEAWKYDQRKQAESLGWEPSRRVRAMFPTHLLSEAIELGRADPYGAESDPRFNDLVDELTRAFVVASRRYFRLQRKRPIIKPFHAEIARALIVALCTGSKQMILTPPRHGKSETLIRFVVWLIAMDPEIEVMWVCANEGVSKLMLGAVKDYLENSEELVKDTLPPGQTYRPAWGENKPWTTTEIKTSQNKQVGQKSSTVLALGRTSKILSRDVRLLIVDDLEDFDSTKEPAQRQYSREKLAEIGTRKEEWTAWVYIGSRQHPEDVPSYLMSHTEQGWKVIEYAAHDDLGCTVDPELLDKPEHYGDHYDCMLFPEVRSYRWLMEKKAEVELLGLPGTYDMRYQNKPRPTSGVVFRMDEIKANALDHSRGLGLGELPDGIRLMAGLDPSSRGTQAAVCWGYYEGTVYLVDIETQEAGGFEGALKIMERWYDEYDLTEWFYEDNSQQIEFFRLDALRELKAELGLTVKHHRTGKNKQDPELGISSMAPRYHDGTINLPWGTAEARSRVNVLLRQLELWSTDGITRKGLTDVKMASWFPWSRLLRLLRKRKLATKVKAATSAAYPKPVAGTWKQRTLQRSQYPRR